MRNTIYTNLLKKVRPITKITMPMAIAIAVMMIIEPADNNKEERKHEKHEKVND